MSILTSSPPVSAYRAQPYSVEELDALGDDRIWATILETRRHCDEEISNREKERSHLIYEESDLEAAKEEGEFDTLAAVERILDSEVSDAEKLSELERLL